MKLFLLIVLSFMIINLPLRGQITTAAIRANFGVDADLRSNYYNGAIQAGNDDWYMYPGSAGTGQFIIDTTGAAAIVNRYATDVAFRRLPFFRTMRFPQFSVVNNRLLIDAVFIRDYHGDDSTIFASGSNKNGMSPADWSCPISQQIPDKNDILDMFVHVRRAGPNATDSLWMFGGVSIENVTGNRYFDFEMYQTDIYYDRMSQRFYNYGPEAGHTAWRFDAAGNVTKAGDIIFTAEYGSSNLSFIEARIWIDRASLSLTPAAFTWSGQFDGAFSSSQYGYASIQPKVAGTFYTGMQCGNNTWAGSFSLIRENNTVVTDYIARQFMEFSVNLTKLGLDPVSLLGESICGMPFRRVFVKSRASTSFTAELKDFIGPMDFFIAPRVNVVTDAPYLCESGGISNIDVTNPIGTSTYVWSTPDGNIVGGNTGTSIDVDTPGTYIVTQYLQNGCPAYATDTAQILPFNNCQVMKTNLTDFRGLLHNNNVQLNWTVQLKQVISHFDIERSTDGIHFTLAGRIDPDSSPSQNFVFGDNVSGLGSPAVYYRLRIKEIYGGQMYSQVIRIALQRSGNNITILPNPVKDFMQVNISSSSEQTIQIRFYDQQGKLIRLSKTTVQKGDNVITVNDVATWERGIYLAVIPFGNEVVTKKIVLTK